MVPRVARLDPQWDRASQGEALAREMAALLAARQPLDLERKDPGSGRSVARSVPRDDAEEEAALRAVAALWRPRWPTATVAQRVPKVDAYGR